MKTKIFIGIIVVIALAVIVLLFNMFTTIPAGHVGVGSMFGKVQTEVYEEGFHLVNPLVDITLFDAREKTYKDTMAVPSQDQLLTRFDISIQYRLIKALAPTMLKETGGPEDVIDVHMLPVLRSQMREIGKSVPTAENFYDQQTQQRLQSELFINLTKYLAQKGIKVEKLLIRDITLPKIITDAVMRKKQAAQDAEKAKEELKKFRVEQEKKEAQALAEKKAEIIEAQKKAEVALTIANGELAATKIDAQAILVRAQAEATARKKQIDVVGRDGYVKLEALKVIPNLANGNHIFMMDGKTNALPFMNMADFAK
jgi:regulator of protease activity HflC (stomatin/prohibitin superfamily)